MNIISRRSFIGKTLTCLGLGLIAPKTFLAAAMKEDKQSLSNYALKYNLNNDGDIFDLEAEIFKDCEKAREKTEARCFLSGSGVKNDLKIDKEGLRTLTKQLKSNYKWNNHENRT